MFATAALALASCSNNADFGNAVQPDTQKAEQYAAKFTETFGEINQNNDWGFTPVAVPTVKNDVTYGYDEETTTKVGMRRAHNVNRNEWGTGNGNGGHVAVPVNVTDKEADLVFAWFNQDRSAWKNTQVNWVDFFVSQVWKGEDVYKDGFGNDVKGSDCMNHLQVRIADGTIDEWGALKGNEDQYGNQQAWEHVNDFNNANQYGNYGDIKGHTFMQSSGTLEFAYHNTRDSKYHNEYIIVPGEVIDASLAGYYYVGFDFYATHPIGQDANKNMDVARDFVFTDWIVRISPGEFTNAKRIMAEDLIASSNIVKAEGSDLDFNDVVFDVAVFDEWIPSLNNNKRVAHVTLRAAGGTLPLHIGQLDDAHEVHNLFGVSTKTMVNTGAQAYATNGYEAKDNVPVAQFKLILGDAYQGDYNYEEFPVWVGGNMLTAKLGQAPYKLCVPTTTKWMKEKVIITNGYPKFADYVTTGAPEDWYSTIGTGLYK